MNVFQKIFTNIKAKALNMPFVASLQGRYQTLTDMLKRRDFLKEYKNWVFACIQARAEEVSNIELVLKSNGEIIDSHPALDLIKKVNPTMTKQQLFEATQSFLDLDGNAFWYLARENKGKGTVAEIYVLRPDKVQLIQSKENPLQVEGYVFTQPDGQKIPFEPQEVLHFKTFNPLGNHPFPHRGVGIVEAAAWTIDTDNEARTWNFNFFKNSARPDGILTTAGEGGMDSDEYKRLREEWNTQHQGTDNAHKIAVLSGGLSWTEIARSQKEMDFVALKNSNRDEILALFKVPKSIIGITDDVNRANADAAIYVFALRTVKPLMQKMVDALNEFFLPEFGEELEFDFKSPVVEDRKQSIDEYTSGIAGGWLSPNEVRAEEGLPEVEGGDALFMPFNMQPIGTVPKAVKAPKKITAKEKKPSAKNEKLVDEFLKKKATSKELVDAFIESKKSKTKLPVAKKFYKKGGLSEQQKEKYIELWKAHININSQPLQKKLKAYFNDQKKEVMNNARQQMKHFSAKEIFEKGIDDFLFDEDDAIETGISLVTPFIRDYINTSGNNAANLLGTEFDSSTDKISKFIETRAKYFAETINNTTREDLLSSIQEGLDDGEDFSAIQERIAGVYDIAVGSRTQMIARTEVSAASNQGSIDAYSQAGVEQIQWVVVNPQDEDCLVNDGEVVDIGDAFPSGDTEPPVHPNCECTTIPVFD